jgi:hypothetical protein
MSSKPIIQKMTQLAQAWETQNDQRAIFLRCYSMMTDNMMDAVQAKRFQDNAWVEKLLHHFADYYFNALACFDCGDQVPPVWQAVHQRAQGPLHVMQHLLLGINAHINYDLVLSIYDMLKEEWPHLDDQTRTIRQEDHRLVNVIIGETIDKVQDEVIEKHDPRMDWLDQFLGRIDEKLLSLLISRWRAEVWDKAQVMLDCPNNAMRTTLNKELEQEVLRLGKWIALDF